MKKYLIFFAYLFSIICLTILFAILHSTAMVNLGFAKTITTKKADIGQKISTCDVYYETQEFVTFIQDKSQENPNKFAQKNKDFEKLAQEIEELTVKGDKQAICDKYREFKIKF